MKQDDRWIFYALLGLLLWIPIPFGSNRAWAWSFVEIYIYLMFLIWFVKFGKQLNVYYLRPYKPILYILTLLQLWVLIQIVPLPMPLIEVIAPNVFMAYERVSVETAQLSLDPARTLMQWLKGMAYLMFVFLLLVLVNNEKRLRLLLLTLVIAGIYQALYGALFVMTGEEPVFFSDDRSTGLATGTFIYRNHFANFLMMCLSVGVGLLVASLTSTRRHSIKRSVANVIETLLSPKALIRIGLVVMVIALVLSRSRMGNTAFFAALSFCSVFALVFMQNKTRGLLWLFGSMLVIDVIIVSQWFGLEEVRQRITETSAEAETRDEVIQYGLELVKQHPITGTGHGSFNSVFPSVKGVGVNLFYNFAHNEYLQFTIELGIPITLMLGLLVMWSLWNAQFALRNRKRSLMKGLAFASMMAIIGQLIHMSVDFTLQPPANAIYFLVVLCLAWLSRYAKFEPEKFKSRLNMI